MGELVQLRQASSGASPNDHLALRSLLKYMSLSLRIPYKAITPKESEIKNYTANKSIRGPRLQAIFTEYSQAASRILPEYLDRVSSDEIGLLLVKCVFGEAWLKTHGIDVSPATKQASLEEMLMQWLGVDEEEAAQVEQRYRGLWRVMRAASPLGRPTSKRGFELTHVNHSLLNIQPRGTGELCHFHWYSRGRHSEKDETRVTTGFVIPNVDRLEFLGHQEGRQKLMTLMFWRFIANFDATEHTEVSNGISLSLNSEAAPIGAHVRAFFVPSSDTVEGAAFDALRQSERKQIGVRPTETLRADIPQEHYDRTIEYLSEYEPIIGIHPTRSNNPNA